MLARRREPRGRRGARRLPAQPRGAGGAAREHVRLPGRRRRRRCRPTGRSSPSSPTTRTPSTRPTIAANRDEWLREWSDVTSPVNRGRRLAMSHAAAPAARPWPAVAAVPVLVLGVFFVLPVSGMLARGLLAGRHLRPRRRRSRCWPGRGCTGCCGSRVWSAAGGDAWSRCCSGCRPRTRCTGCAFPGRDAASARRCWCRSCCRPSWSASRSGSCSARPGRWASSASTAPPAAIVAGLVFFNVAVVIRAVGAAWESPRPAAGRGRGRAGREPGPGVPHRHAARAAPGDRVGGQRGLPVLRDRVRRRADPGRAALLLGRDRDLPAHHQPARPAGRRRALDPAAGRGRPGCWCVAGRLRAVPDPGVARRRRRARRPARGDVPALLVDACSLLVLVAAPIATLVVRVAAGRRRLGPGQLPRADHQRHRTRRCWSRSPTRWSPRCAPPSTRPGCRCRWGCWSRRR